MALGASPSGRWLLSAGYDATLRLWSLPDGAALAVLGGIAVSATRSSGTSTPREPCLAPRRRSSTVAAGRGVTGTSLIDLTITCRG